MLTFDTTTAAGLALAASKLAWCDLIALNLGAAPRKLVCKRAASGDAWATGTIFRDLDMTGTISTSGALLTNFGVTSNARVKLAADLTTGVSVWRISNTAGTRWIQGTLGAPGSGADIERANPTATSGDDFSAVYIRPPQLMPSGTGPASPSWTSETPKYVVFDTWNGTTFVNGEGNVNTETEYDERGPNWVASHPFLASQLGDVAWHHCSKPIRVGTHLLFPQLFRHHAGCTQSGTRPLEAAWISARPVAELPGDWDTFPALGRQNGDIVYDRKNPRHSTYVVAGRVRFLNDQREEVGRIEWPNGRPINDPLAAQDEMYDRFTGGNVAASTLTRINDDDGVQVGWAGSGDSWSNNNSVAIFPHWNIAQPLLWENEMAADMPHNIFAGVEADVMVPYLGKSSVGFNPMNQMLYNDAQQDNLNNPWVNGPYPQSRSEHPRLEPIDPYATTPNLSSRPYNAWATGMNYMPGAFGGHDIYPGPGGMREDRAPVAMRLTRFITDPNGVRLEGEIPHREWAWQWCKNYANLARVFITGSQLESIDKAQSMAGQWRQHGGYYGPGTGTNDRKIDWVALGNGSHKRRYGYSASTSAQNWIDVHSCGDSTGRHPYGYQLPESQHHGCSAPGSALLAFKDARFAILQRYFFDTARMSRLGSAPATTSPTTFYGQRTHAWRWSDYFYTWYSAAEHPLSHSRQSLEANMQTELEKIDTEVYQPAFVNNGGQGDDTIFAQTVRRFGQPMTVTREGDKYTIRETGGSKWYYSGLPFMFMKTSGLWDILKGKSPSCANGLKCMIHTSAMASIDWMNYTGGVWTRYSRNGIGSTGGHFWGGGVVVDTRTDFPLKPDGTPYTNANRPDALVLTTANLASGWPAIPAVMPENGLADYWHEYDGAWVTAEDPPLHARAQWPSIHKKFFEAEYPWLGLDTALATYKQIYADRNSFAFNATDVLTSKSGHNWRYRIASYGFVKQLEVA
jgi:hypothetical protein